MKLLIKLLFVGIVAGGWLVSAASLHVVRTPDRIVIATKNQPSFTNFKDTYVDARAWSLADVGAHQALVQRLVELNKQDALAFLVDSSKGDVKTQLLEAAAKGPPAPAEPAKTEPAKSDHKPESGKHGTSSARRL